MSRYNQLAQRVIQLQQQYRGEPPLSFWLKEHFRQNKQMGSTDRKLFSALIYGIYRILGARRITPTEEMAETGACLQPGLPPAYLDYLREKDAFYARLLDAESNIQRLELLKERGWEEGAFFPCVDKLSKQIEQTEFIAAHLFPRKVWLRVRKGAELEVQVALKANGFNFTQHSPNCYVSDLHYPLHTLDIFEKGLFEIQDIASQDTGHFFHPEKASSWFDCCAGSGGKSLMLLDKEEDIRLTVNDTRGEMLDELRERFEKAGMPAPKVMQADLEAGIYEGLGPFDGIIADLPCTGSGTWGRSPERMHFFSCEHIASYAARQRAIIEQVAKVLKPEGELYYITCSVYAAENEDNVAMVCADNQLVCTNQQYLYHHHEGGDTLYIAVLKKA